MLTPETDEEAGQKPFQCEWGYANTNNPYLTALKGASMLTKAVGTSQDCATEGQEIFAFTSKH
jgi:hypothetical protein